MNLKMFAVVGMLIGFLLSPGWASASQQVLINHPGDAACWYNKTAEDVLRLALQKSAADYGPIDIQYTDVTLPLSRAMLELQFGERLNIQAAPAADKWPQGSIPIPIPIFQGLSGYQRVYRSAEDRSLDWVFKADQLKMKTTAMQSGCGKLLGDLLARNGLSVRRVSSGASLLSMVELDRVDLIAGPAAAAQVAGKTIPTSSSRVVVDPKIMLYVPMPVYFYVSEEHPELARRVSLGMQRAVKDGSLDRLLTPYRNRVLHELKSRRLISMKNLSAPEHLQVSNSGFPGLTPTVSVNKSMQLVQVERKKTASQ